jgi:predicted nucleic acid-binding protein
MILGDKTKIYFDSCCYGRPFDNPAHRSQASVEAQIVAIKSAVELCKALGIGVVGSPTVELEIGRIEIKDAQRYRAIRDFYEWAISDYIEFNDNIFARAQEIRGQALVLGRVVRNRDSFHAALAEAAGVGFLLTVDDRFERAGGELKLKTKIINPINFLQEFATWAQLLT